MKFHPMNRSAREVADQAKARYLSTVPAPEDRPESYATYRQRALDVWTATFERELTARGLPTAAAGVPSGRRAIPLPPARAA